MEKLPPELIQNIGSFLAPEAIDSFTSTSKHIRRILKPLIDRHQSLKRDFGHAICGRNQSHGSIGRLLLNVISRQRLCYYIRKLTIEDWHNELSADDIGNKFGISSTSRNEMRQALHIGPTSLSSAISKLGTEDGVFPLLLWELSELRVLRLAGEPLEESTIIEALVSIDEHQGHPSVPLFPGFLSHLRELQLHTSGEGQESIIGMCTAKTFAALIPSLRRISVNNIGEDDSDGWSFQLLAKPSNVEHLEFNSCVVEDKLMHRFLQGFPNLKTFTVNELPGQCTTRIDCYWLCVSLQMHCNDSLQSLTLNIPSHDSFEVANFLGDISMFKTLRYLELYPEALIRWADPNEALLPKSIEELHVKCGNDAESFAALCGDSTSLVKESRRRKSNLKQITIECNLVRERAESSQFITLRNSHRFRKFGVQLVFLKRFQVPKVQRIRQWEL